MEYYNWILAFHVMSFISWMAMLFYQPRLYVYHQSMPITKGLSRWSRFRRTSSTTL
ncbi:protoporphyrinogen IX oxidase, novel form, HemJ [Hydrogenimonas sp.]|nr:protoporphyrinogen IX oxidase, novel form, HemJ [Hydrogenimonas sp.]